MEKITDNNFEQVVKSNEMLGIVYFAEWCQPSQDLVSTFEQASVDISYPCYQCNIDEAISTIEAIEIRGVPTIIIYKNGQEYKRNVGLVSKDDLLKMFD